MTVESDAAALPRPLDGVRVLDLSQVVSGPICGRMLADLGADVVKVEPAEGDIIRMLRPQVGDDPVSVYFTWVNAGKRSISVDLRTDEGADLVRRLALTSDVLLDNFRPDVLAKFGLDAEHPARAASPTDLLLDQRLGTRQLVVAATGVRRDGAGRGRTRRARRAPAERAARAEPARRRRHHARPARGQRHPRRAVPARAHGSRPAPRRVDGRSARLHRRVDVDRARLRTTDHGSPTPGTTRCSRWPTAPRPRSWAIRRGA